MLSTFFFILLPLLLFLRHSISNRIDNLFLFLNLQVFDQWQQGRLLQNLFAGVSHSLVALREEFKQGSEPRKVVEILCTGLIILSDSLAADGPGDSHLLPQM